MKYCLISPNNLGSGAGKHWEAMQRTELVSSSLGNHRCSSSAGHFPPLLPSPGQPLLSQVHVSSSQFTCYVPGYIVIECEDYLGNKYQDVLYMSIISLKHKLQVLLNVGVNT